MELKSRFWRKLCNSRTEKSGNLQCGISSSVRRTSFGIFFFDFWISLSTVQIHEAKAKLSGLIEAALSGEEIIIAKRNKPLVRLVPLTEEDKVRKIGTAKGRIRVAEDFDEIPDGFEEYAR